MDLELKGKRALITGASKGIGRAVAETLAEEGCDLEIAARGSEEISQLADQLSGHNRVRVGTHTVDLSKPEDQRRLVEACGEVDILINNAGSNPGGEIDEISEDLWRESWDLKVFGYINLTRAYFTMMKARGHGVIVNVIGNSGQRMNSRYILGSTGNAGLMALTQTLGGRSPDFGVRVVGVNPGLTATDRAMSMLRNWSEQRFGTPDRWEDFLAEMNLPFGRMGEPREVANVIAFVASPRAAYVSGTIVTVDGGATNRVA